MYKVLGLNVVISLCMQRVEITCIMLSLTKLHVYLLTYYHLYLIDWC